MAEYEFWNEDRLRAAAIMDAPSARAVVITVDAAGKVWVNVDGACALRIGRAEIVTLDDPHRGVDTAIYRKG